MWFLIYTKILSRCIDYVILIGFRSNFSLPHFRWRISVRGSHCSKARLITSCMSGRWHLLKQLQWSHVPVRKLLSCLGIQDWDTHPLLFYILLFQNILYHFLLPSKSICLALNVSLIKAISFLSLKQPSYQIALLNTFLQMYGHLLYTLLKTTNTTLS